MPGVGPATTRTLIAELPEPGRPCRRKAAALVGAAPVSRDSGQPRGRRTVQSGHHGVCATLHTATLAAIRCDASIAAAYRHLRERGKSAEVALVACMREPIVILDAMLRDEASWSPASWCGATTTLAAVFGRRHRPIRLGPPGLSPTRRAPSAPLRPPRSRPPWVPLSPR